MAAQLNVNVYQINNMDPIPVGNIQKMGFPTGNVILRSAGPTGTVLSNNITVYGVIQVVTTGSQYVTNESEAQLVTLANA